MITPDQQSSPFVHVGAFHSDPEELVATALPLVRRSLYAGDAVTTVLGPRSAHLLREAVGDDAAMISFRAPSEILGPDPGDLLAKLRSLARTNHPRRTLVLGEYQPFTPAWVSEFWESACSLVLADLPMTLLCTCARDGDARSVDAVLTGHPRLLTGGRRARNPRYRVPPDRCPSPASLWGPRWLRVSFHGLADLVRVRERVARVAKDLGMDDDTVAEVVLAVHEAALLACGSGDLEQRDTGGRGCFLEIRTRGPAMLAEVFGPSNRVTESGERELHYIRSFCGAATLREDEGTRTVRVVTSGRHAVVR